ncbi:hypothetical protein [Micromonospora sp. NPDC051296]|uniref:hypothetical protein n=1 Tax=Micromonospora sp. NPDC051296 TaxID=3155046 RepID=UPI00344A411A
MAIFPVRAALTTMLGAVLPVLLLAGCADGGAPAVAASSGPSRTVPDDFCDRIDYALATSALGEEMPLPVGDDNRGPGVKCDKGFFGGSVIVQVQTFASAGEARTGFERSATVTSAEPFEDGSMVVADAVRYQQTRGDARIEILDANVIMEVRLASYSVSDEQAAALPSATVQVAVQALELTREP